MSHASLHQPLDTTNQIHAQLIGNQLYINNIKQRVTFPCQGERYSKQPLTNIKLSIDASHITLISFRHGILTGTIMEKTYHEQDAYLYVYADWVSHRHHRLMVKCHAEQAQQLTLGCVVGVDLDSQHMQALTSSGRQLIHAPLPPVEAAAALTSLS